MTFVVGLDGTSAGDTRVVGGKGSGLARLIGAGMAVPAGFCVTTAAYEAVIDDPEIRWRVRALTDLDPADGPALAEAGKDLRERILDRGIPESVGGSIEQAFDALGAETVAVRSSATVEDLPSASVAGQHETFLNVPAGGLLEAVCACMASLFSDRAIAYRARNGIPHEDAALAVVVQRQLDPEAAGVLFTADPQTGQRRVAVMEASFGLGAGLVAGAVAADHARVDRASGERTYDVGDKRLLVRLRSAGGTDIVELDPERRRARALTETQVDRLVQLGERVEGLFGAPQDIEWALVEGEFVMLQSRPITSLFPLPEPLPSDGRLHAYLSMGHLQAFPEAMPPLVSDFWAGYINQVFAGFAPDAPPRRAVQAGGRVYVDITPMLGDRWMRGRLVSALAAANEPASAGLRDLLERRAAAFARPASTAPSTRAGAMARTLATSAQIVIGLVPLVAAFLVRFVGAFAGRPADPGREQQWWEDFGRRLGAPIDARKDLVERVRATFAVSDRILRAYPHAAPLFAAFVAGGLLQRWFRDAPIDVNDVGKGFAYDIVTRINLGLGDVADVARAHPAVVEAMRAEQVVEALRAEQVTDRIRAVDGGEEFVSALGRYLDEFGHRATGELDLSRPRWREDPSALLRIIRANLAHDEVGAHHAHLRRLQLEARAAADRLERRARKGLLGPVRRRAVHRLLRTYRGHIGLREHPKQGVAHLFVAWREALRDAGAHLAATGRLDRPDDVWLLHKHELLAALDGAVVEADLEARRAEFAQDAGRIAPPLLTSEGEAPSPGQQRDDVPEGALAGTPVSAGVVEGFARVIRDPSSDTVERGEILVAPSTDPGWTPLFLNAAGLVTEVGGRLSHGALVAREYGLPAVVSVPQATSRIRTGQRLRIDGTKGIVELLD